MGQNNRQSAPFAFKSKRINVYKPTDGQMTVLVTIGSAKSNAAQTRAVTQFFRILEALVIKPADWDFLEEALIIGAADIPDYLSLMKSILEHEWNDDDADDEDE